MRPRSTGSVSNASPNPDESYAVHANMAGNAHGSPSASPPTINEPFPIEPVPSTQPSHGSLRARAEDETAPRPLSGLSARSGSPIAGAASATPGRRRASLSRLGSHTLRRPNVLSSTREEPSFQPSIRLRRMPSHVRAPSDSSTEEQDAITANRRRSSSEPQRPTFAHDGSISTPARSPAPPQRWTGAGAGLPDIQEGVKQDVGVAATTNDTVKAGGKNARAPSRGSGSYSETQYERSLVDILDLVDPEVSTLQSLTNVQNSLFVPNLGRFLNRTPTYNLSRRPTNIGDQATAEDRVVADEKKKQTTSDMRPDALSRTATITSVMSVPNERYYAVLPHGVRLDGWSQADVDELNDHVRHMLHSRRSKFKRGLKGFGQYVRKPLGFFITLYATLITLFGLAWVLFLIGWINVGGRKDYIVNVIDNVLVALFAIMGDGLIPWRIVDTYHMIHIAKYHHISLRLRKQNQLPQLQDPNDLPALRPTESLSDLEDGLPAPKENEYSVLSEEQQRKLIHHQKKFSKSHTFYKPHETTTHHAFPHHLLVAIVLLLDLHSCLQVSLGTCTWAISYHDRPFALTTVILCCSITVNITAGILISVGDRRTRKKDILEIMKTQELTKEALEKIQQRREREAEQDRALEAEVGHASGPLTSEFPAVEEKRSHGSDGAHIDHQDSHHSRTKLHKEHSDRSDHLAKAAKIKDEKEAQEKLREHHEKMGTAARKSMDVSRANVPRDSEGVRRRDFADA